MVTEESIPSQPPGACDISADDLGNECALRAFRQTSFARNGSFEHTFGQTRIAQIEFEHSVDFTLFSAENHGLERKNAFTHWISIVFILMESFTTTYVTLGMFHMGNLGL